jgi:hypothetical protein
LQPSRCPEWPVLLFLTFSGGCIGYRQANSVRFLRAQDAERFLR